MEREGCRRTMPDICGIADSSSRAISRHMLGLVACLKAVRIRIERIAALRKNREKRQRIRILVIGSLPPPIGGTTVSLSLLVNHLVRMECVALRVINTSGVRGSGLIGLLRLARCLLQMLWGAFRSDVLSAHFNNTPMAFIGLFVVLVGRLIGRPVVLRKFGGNPFHLRRFGRWAVKLAIRNADLYLVQTHELVQISQEQGARNPQWYPTSRPRSTAGRVPSKRRNRCQRFVFVGHVKEEKGIPELIVASELLPKGASVHVYGPLTGGVSERDFSGRYQVAYRGVLEPEKVSSTLTEYDALVLPTYYPGEGYPGAIIEAYAAGLPVICTRWQALPEIVDEKSGILVPPRDAEALADAMSRLVANSVLYNRLCEGALARGAEFDSDLWSVRFVEFCRMIAR